MASVYERIKEASAEQVKDWTNVVLSGSCRSYDEYKFYTGLIGGAERTIETVKEVLAKLQREESE